MKITKIDIPRDQISNGLERVKMDRLGQVVLLAGRNGAGKSRLMNLVEEKINLKPKQSALDGAKKNKVKLEKQLSQYELNIENWKEQISRSTDNQERENLRENINKRQDRINNCLTAHKDNETILNWNLIETEALAEKYSIVPFIPKDLNLKDSNKYNKQDIAQFAQQVNSVGIRALSNGTFPRILMIQERWFNATHQDSEVQDEEREAAIQEYESLQTTLRFFLNSDLGRNLNGEPTLFGFPLGQANLSDGQKVLIQLCLAIHCQGQSLDDIVLFLDEPENHLHPSAVIEVVERITERLSNGQIWIATHSIPLLSYFDPSSIWYIEKGKVSFAGSIPENVLRGLIGDENKIAKLQDFLSLPSIFALNRHAFESLFQPESVSTSSDDPQTLQINDEIKAHLANSDNIRILDYGAGKCRLLANIIENSRGSEGKLSDWLDYIAYDKFDSDKGECIGILEKIYSGSKKRYFNEFSELFGVYDRGSFDIVVMCNVLHEIDPQEWLKLFSADGEIPSLLSDTGILLLVEDQEMLIGEKAYQKGFLVLNTQELKALFSIRESDQDFGYSDARDDGRLKAHRIKKELLTRITTESRLKAIKLLNNTALDKTVAVRDEEVCYKNGKKHGFWVQQFTNSALALKELGG